VAESVTAPDQRPAPTSAVERALELSRLLPLVYQRF
jgi:hypothetical protein